MQFHPARYLEAVKAMDFSGIECNLAFSGIPCPYSLAELGISARIFDATEFHDYGNQCLKEQIAERYHVHPDQVLVPSGGSTLCNFLFACTLLDHGGKVLVEAPTYEPLQALVASTGAEIVPLPRPPQNDYRIDVDHCLDLITPDVELVVLTRLHNPSGRDIPETDLLRIGQKAEEVKAYVLVDEVYLDFMPEGKRRAAATLHPRLLTTNSLTKVYGQGSLRIGWGLGPRDLVWTCWRAHNLLGSIPPVIPDQIAIELFRDGGIDRIGAWSRRRSAENLAIIAEWIERQPALSWAQPDAGIIAAVRLEGVSASDRFISLLKEKYRTAVMPGKYFDLPDGFRLGFGVDSPQLQEGLRRIDLALQEYLG